MNDTAKVIRPHIPPGRRVLAISDIHGNLSFFGVCWRRPGFLLRMC